MSSDTAKDIPQGSEGSEGAVRLSGVLTGPCTGGLFKKNPGGSKGAGELLSAPLSAQLRMGQAPGPQPVARARVHCALFSA